MARSSTTVLPIVLLDSFRSFLYFPVWWYSVGLINFIERLLASVTGFNNILGFTIWLRNIFTPLFNQRDFASRLISFFLRLVNIIIRGLGLAIVILIHLLILALWLVLPPLLLILIFS